MPANSNSIGEFSNQFHDEIAADANALELLKEHMFVEKMGEILVEYGEIEDMIRSSYKGHGLKIDGYHFDDEFNTLTLLISHFIDEREPTNSKLYKTDLESAFKRGVNFLTKSAKGLHNKIEIANEAHDLSSLIYECRNDLESVKIILITDGFTKARPAEIYEVDGFIIKLIIWDLERTYNFVKTGQRESIQVDFVEEFGTPIPCLIYIDDENRYTTYVSFINGEILANLYSKWGTRLLDMNVRVFLSARGKVNRGIRDTINNEPEMFCAYNNGITVFSTGVDIVNDSNGQPAIASASNFQIVNGGQTTASLYHSRKKYKANLSNTFVQMKLTIIHNSDEIEVLVPKISEYSNTQNKIQMADLMANDPPHPELHAISLTTLAPDPTGGSKQTYWFYEKSRGSYEESRNLKALTQAQRKKYDSLYPKKQKFDKNKFGKAWNTYLLQPHVVSLGAQKNFARFNSWLREQVDEDWTAFYKKTIALVLLWNTTETLVRRQRFEGYRHNIVTYTLAWLFKLTGKKIDLDRIWDRQIIDDQIMQSLEPMCHIVNQHIRNTDKNVTEWCKREDCWKKLLEHDFQLDENIKDTFIDSTRKNKEYDPSISNEKEAIHFCKEKGSDAWFKLSKWLKERQFLSGKARSQCYNMGRILNSNREPSVALSLACEKAWNNAEVRGWDITKETG